MKFSDKPAAWTLAWALSCFAVTGLFWPSDQKKTDPSFGAATPIATGSQQSRCRSAEVVRVIDGDTIECRVLLIGKDEIGSDLSLTTIARLHGINSPDTNPDGEQPTKAATANLQKLISKHCPAKSFSAELLGRDKYGRILMVIRGVDRNGGEVNLNQKMIDDGHAKKYLP